jgi:tetratricopeptide (TPR) repeat protein
MSSPNFTNPYPGTAPFQDRKEDRLIFFGRDQEISHLKALVLSEQQVLLFARSGLGKTSLINAGLLHELRKSGFFPVSARVTHDEEGGPAASTAEYFVEEAKKHNVRIIGTADVSSLWAYFDSVKCLSEKDKLLKPVLILDQFEELFTRLNRSERERFIGELAELASGHAPRELRHAALKELDELPQEPNSEQPDAKRRRLLDVAYGNMVVDVKILISIREDFLAELEALKGLMPNLFRHTLRLEALRREQAKEAIVNPSQQREILGENTIAIQPEAVNGMLDFLSGQQIGGAALQSEDIEPVQLQILCRSLFERVRKQGRNEISVHDLGGQRGMARILRRYYYEVVRQFPILRFGWNSRKYRPSISNLWLFNLPRYAIRQLCENGLILRTGFRNSLEGGYIASAYGVPEDDLGQLVRQRLLRSESRLRGRFYELAHDSLTGILVRSRMRRRVTMVTGAASIAAIGLLVDQTELVSSVRAIPARQAVASANNDQARIAAIIRLGQLSNVINLSRLNLNGLELNENVFKQLSNHQWDFRFSTLSDSRILDVPPIDSKGGREFLLQNPAGREFLFQNSTITRTKFNKSDLSLSSFAGARINDASFVDARLLDANFVGARLTKVNFSNASLAAEDVSWLFANFMGATLTDVNFSNANVRRVNFSSVEMNGVIFKDAAWWLARGWSKEQIVQLEKEFPHKDYARSQGYLSGLRTRNERIEFAQARADASALAKVLNSRAWYRAIHGVELQAADQDISKALETDPNNEEFLDTRAYVMMQNKKFQEAKSLLARALRLGAPGRPDPSPTELRGKGEIVYKYALALDCMGEVDEADKFYQISSNDMYRPTHELLLVPRPDRMKR